MEGSLAGCNRVNPVLESWRQPSAEQTMSPEPVALMTFVAEVQVFRVCQFVHPYLSIEKIVDNGHAVLVQRKICREQGVCLPFLKQFVCQSKFVCIDGKSSNLRGRFPDYV